MNQLTKSTLMMVLLMLCFICLAYSLPSQLNEIRTVNHEHNNNPHNPIIISDDHNNPVLSIDEKGDNAVEFTIHTQKHGDIVMACEEVAVQGDAQQKREQAKCTITLAEGVRFDDLKWDDFDFDIDSDDYQQHHHHDQKQIDKAPPTTPDQMKPHTDGHAMNTMQWGYNHGYRYPHHHNYYPHYGHHHHYPYRHHHGNWHHHGPRHHHGGHHHH